MVATIAIAVVPLGYWMFKTELKVDVFSMQGKTVLITGASSGFGHHFAGVLAAAGALSLIHI